MATDKYFQPLNSPIATRQRVQNSFDFDSTQERNSVDLSKIRNFSFNSGQGGTLTLGGTANGNGFLQIKDSSGSVIVTGDNTGLTIDGGNIVVKNSNNTTIIDTSGIVSSNNFIVDQVSSSSRNSTTGTAYIDLPGSSLNSFVLERPTIVSVIAQYSGLNVGRVSVDSSSSLSIKTVDSIDGDLIHSTLIGNFAIVNIDFVAQTWTNLIDDELQSVTGFFQLSAGTHTLKLQYKMNTAGTANVDFFSLGYSILGS